MMMHNPCPLPFSKQKSCLIVGSITELSKLQELLAQTELLESCDMLEFRLDEHCDIAALEQALEKMSQILPTLLTIRTNREGGEWEISDPERAKLFSRFVGKVSAFDFEIESELFAQYKKADYGSTFIIASYHDYIDCPSDEALLNKISKAKQNSDLVKLAIMAHTKEDLDRLKSICQKFSNPHVKLCIVGMGEFSLTSRIDLPQSGSALTYGYIDKPVAPGQPSCAELKAKLY